MRENNPSKTLKLLTEFTLIVYAKAFFAIKWEPHVGNASRHVLNIIKGTR